MPDESKVSKSLIKPFRFMFDFDASNPFHSNLTKEFEDLERRIDKLVNEPTIDGQPVIQFIFKMCNPEPDDLKLVGRALIRLAELYPDYEEAKQKLAFVEYARKHPDVTALAFGDFTPRDSDIEELLSKDSKENQ